MGVAVGCIGLSLDDFSNCDYDEFEAICKAWREMTEGKNREAWERTRITAAICIQPHCKKKITPKQLLPLPWDKKRHGSGAQPELTPEQKRKRFEEIAHRLGDEINQ